MTRRLEDWKTSDGFVSSFRAKARDFFRSRPMTHASSTCAAPLSAFIILFHNASALSAPSGHLPLEGKAAIRESPLLKRQRCRRPVSPSAPQAPSSRAKPRDLYCTAAICTHAPSLKRHLGASFFAFPSPTIYRSAKKIPPLR